MNDDTSMLNDDAVMAAAHMAGREPALTGCPWHDVNEMLQAAGLRPTRQRMALGWLLFGKGARHLTAEMLSEEATLAPPFLSRKQPRTGRYSRSASRIAEDAGSSRRLRDRPGRHGGPAAQEALSFFRRPRPLDGTHNR
jgi:hypothetical protein